MRDIGKNIKQIRLAKGMSQEDLAKALYVTRQTVSNYENSRSNPDIDMLIRIAESLGTDVTMLIYGSVDPFNQKMERRRFLIAVLITVVCGIMWGYSNHLEWLTPSPIPILLKHLNNLIIPPITMLVGGWSLLQLLGLRTQIKHLSEQHRKTGKIILFLILGCIIIIPLPYIIWMIIVIVRMLFSIRVQMTFPYIPMYSPVALGILKIVYHAPFIFGILGGAFWIAEIPFERK